MIYLDVLAGVLTRHESLSDQADLYSRYSNAPN